MVELDDINTAWKDFCAGDYKDDSMKWNIIDKHDDVIQMNNEVFIPNGYNNIQGLGTNIGDNVDNSNSIDSNNNNRSNNNGSNNNNPSNNNRSNNTHINNPKCGALYISTKTKISYLSHKIMLEDIFWKVPVISYHLPLEGVIKKQMKFNSLSETELENVRSHIKDTSNEQSRHIDEYVITHLVNPEGRTKFKDVRKISIGLCKKDIISYRCKKKSAFYNCFVLILRIKYEGTFKEVHVKIFNTGKLEIPGIQNDDVLVQVLILLTNTLRPFIQSNTPLSYIKGKCETVLINSNFNCGYLINRDKMFDLLKYKYKINCSYDPCSYPGIQSEFYYDPQLPIQTGRQPLKNVDELKITKISFMVFRTGSVLIVGKCTESVLDEIYCFVKTLLENEYENIGDGIIPDDNIQCDKVDLKKRKVRKRTIIVTNTTS